MANVDRELLPLAHVRVRVPDLDLLAAVGNHESCPSLSGARNALPCLPRDDRRSARYAVGAE